MSALSEIKKEIERLKAFYKDGCYKYWNLITSIESCSADLFSIRYPDKIVSISTRNWNEETFYLFDEVKGINLLLLRLLKKYHDLRLKLNSDIEINIQNLKSILNKYDDDVMEFEPMSEFARDKFEQDRWNILRPFKELEALKNEIESNKITLAYLESKIKEREINVKKYLSYTLKDIIEEQENYKKEIEEILKGLL